MTRNRTSRRPQAGRRRMPMAVLGTAAGLLGAYAVGSWVVYERVSRAAGGCWPDDVDNTPSAYRVRDGFDQTIADRNRMPAPADVRFRSRDPGDSDGHDGRFAAGTDEHLDVLGAWDWVRAQGVPAARIGLLGMSFGAINSVIAGGEDRRVAAVWADSVATRMGEAIGNFVVDQLGDPTGVSRLLVPGGLVWARIIAGDDLTRYDPVDEVGRYADRWIAFVQGEEDRVLPPAMAEAMHEAAVAAGARTAPLWVAPGAGHGEALFFEPDAYERRLVDFFTDALGEP